MEPPLARSLRTAPSPSPDELGSSPTTKPARPDPAEPLTASATQLAAWIREGRLSSREVVDAHIEHVERVNPVINAVVCDRFDAARAEADEADARLRRDGVRDLPPFHGVPVTIKESFALTGMPQTSGLVSRRDVVATENATAVIRLLEAGFIPIGVTNTSELCMWMESNNKVYGRTNNAYDPGRIAGGSSGGEGSIVGAGGAPVGLGADIGGSIRSPAFFNGVFGHKPTGGLVPGTGQYPLAENDALRFLTTGPIARRAEDLMPVLRVLAGPDGCDAGCEPMELGDPRSVSIEGLEVVSVHGNGMLPVRSELRAAQARVEDALRERGARVVVKRIESLKHTLDVWAAGMATAAETSFSELLFAGAPGRPVRELGRSALRRSDFTFPAIALALLEKGAHLLPKRQERFNAMRAELKAELIDAVGDGVMLYPSYPTVAPRHVMPLIPPIGWIYFALFNITELPATQVPLGLNPAGLPLGVQVAAAPGADHRTIGVARFLEDRFGGWVPPPRFFAPRPKAAAAHW